VAAAAIPLPNLFGLEPLLRSRLAIVNFTRRLSSAMSAWCWNRLRLQSPD
jgi:hypothetical protein